jgi:hypothetical protein
VGQLAAILLHAGIVIAATPALCRGNDRLGDSHFFSASLAECAQVHAKYPFFDYETPSAFYVYLPDAATGACAQGAIPLYRVWDNRPDTNHRYTTDPAVREQMVARGWIPEGSGIGVVACVPSN